MNIEEQFDKYVDYLEQLSPANISQFEDFVSNDVRFKDPFNDVKGDREVRKIFNRMLDDLPLHKFKALNRVCGHQSAMMQWQFWPNKDKTLVIEGTSFIRFDSLGQVSEHLDYWDTSSELYAKLPVIGLPTQWLLKTTASPPKFLRRSR